MEGLTPERTAEFTHLKSKLQNLAHEIKALLEQGRSITEDPSQLFLFKGMYKKLDSYFDTFQSTWDKIIELVLSWQLTSLFPSQQDKQLQQTVKRYYYEISAIYEHHMNPTPVAAPAPASGQASTLSESRIIRAQYPKINLPTFDGNQAEWPLFRDTFTALIHSDASLSGIEKFLFLISCLKGPALTLIKGIDIEEANYSQAWHLLNATYNDKRRLANKYLKTVLDYTPLKNKPTSNSIKHLLTTVVECIDSFRKLKIPQADDYLLFYLVLRCLDKGTRTAFETQYARTEFPTYQNLIDFIRIEWRSSELTNEDSGPPSNPLRASHPPTNGRGGTSHASLLVDNKVVGNPPLQRKKTYPDSSKAARISCPVCKSAHGLYQCDPFRKASPSERIKLLKDWKGCTNCLSAKHGKDTCSSQRRCQLCAKMHHTWLHLSQPPTQPTPSASSTVPSTSGITLGTQNIHTEVLLGTAVIEVQSAQGSYQRVRAILDNGSQHSFMTLDCATRLGLIPQPYAQCISGIGQAPLSGIVGKLTCHIRSALYSDLRADFAPEVIVVTRITGPLPHKQLPSELLNLYRSYVLADEEFWKPAPIEFLLGGDLFYDIIKGKPLTLGPDSPKLLPTIFGFVAAGPTKTSTLCQESSTLLAPSTSDMENIMARFWEVEELPKARIVSEEENACESHFISTHSRTPEGRYIVSLPFKDSICNLDNPRQQALTRFFNLEAKLERNASLKEQYHAFMMGYLTLGHMKVAPSDTSLYTIPHHAVYKEQNGQMKLRVVFDASCSTRGGSLNDHLFAGPKLQLDIGDVITSLRVHQFVFIADIVKMYRQILLDPSDRKYQHILWRFNPDEPLQEYELCTVTYGEKASAFLAQRTLKQLVHDEGDSYPLASRALLEDIYVDDIATGASTIEGVMRLKEELVTLLGKGGFHLSKWASNSLDLLHTLREDEIGDPCIALSDDSHAIKILGIQWSPSEDVLSYQIRIPPLKLTKRAILSAIARIYDPLGYLAPAIFFAKTLLQDLWVAKIGWDEVGPSQIVNKWQLFVDQLSCLSEIKLRRHFTSPNATLHLIVGFSDASQRGYSAVLYLLATLPEGVQASLLKAKTKLAPIKPTTIPRLELCGALLLSKLFHSCQGLVTRLGIRESIFFTDSQVVLGWLSTPPELLNTYVAHRIVAILDNTQRNQWKYVPSQENPADCASRGTLPGELLHHPLWWAGPSWLRTIPSNWLEPIAPHDQPLPELKLKNITALNTTSDSDAFDWIERFSTYPKLVRSTAYVLRFINKLQHRALPIGPISLPEYRKAGKLLVKLAQRCYVTFDGKVVNLRSLSSLRPFIDQEGLLRVGGRLEHSRLPYDAKHPYIIPSKSHLTQLLIDHYHLTYLHAGSTALQAMLQTRYWIPGARGIIRRRVFHCVTCYKTTRAPQAPLTGNLPSSRLEEGQVFALVGVDFGGPFYIRESLRRKAALGKAYLCLFVCMSTKAVHLELVSKCTTDAFLAALERFVSRRGKPAHIYSDCGTNFIGSAHRLRKLMVLLRSAQAQERITQYTVPQEIEWSFNPPSAPHFGGLWEAGIKSCKTILHKVIGENALTYEELATLFCRIEGILNSRPLIPMGSDPDNIACLTPGHFLIGRSITALPEEHSPGSTRLSQRWQLIQDKTQHFWNRWRMEYLHFLQQRQKWLKSTPNILVGDLVILKEPNSPQKSWPLARVTETHPGSDGIVRVVTIRTKTGTYKRPVAKLVPLAPLNQQS
ncbi:uncharacterized protein [Rhodnius prolixus]|uniref:uncharacterized protein n=1 Tax=Rhodnius prolixus TaxID=13249 RepID=UPI003D18D7B8